MLKHLALAATFALAAVGISSTAAAQNIGVRTDRIVGGLNWPVYVTHAPGDTSRLFIVQKLGQIRIFDLTTNTLLPTNFLSITVSATSSASDERGLLGMAFDPDYATNGQFYVYYTNATPNNVLARYTVSAANPNVADAASGVIMMQWSDPFTNHNGGWIDFGPDGNLYVAVGDGGSANDPSNRAQTITNMRLGKMLRIRPTVGGVSPYYTIPKGNPFLGVTGDDEIWAYGLRNPWRCSFDRQSGDLWIADVGQNAVEEVNFQKAGSGAGRNYGWRCTEGNANTGLTGCTFGSPSLTAPIRTYTHVSGTSGGFSITGGYVYRGCAISGLQGTYFYADYVNNNVWSFRYDSNTNTQTEFTVRNTQITPSIDGFAVSSIVSFGQDANGEMYIVDQGSAANSGEIFKIVPTTGDTPCAPPCEPADLDCNGVVDAADLAGLLGAWGPCTGTCAADLDGSGTIDAADLAALLSAWG
ncbi:MAG: PQQ-dependent sugar dehydrogenase [Planctomycetota bacterium]